MTGNKDKASALYSKAIEEAASRGHYKLAKAVSDLVEGRSPERVAKPASPPAEQRAIPQRSVSDNHQKMSPSNPAKVSQGNQQPVVVRRTNRRCQKKSLAKGAQKLKIWLMSVVGL